MSDQHRCGWLGSDKTMSTRYRKSAVTAAGRAGRLSDSVATMRTKSKFLSRLSRAGFLFVRVDAALFLVPLPRILRESVGHHGYGFNFGFRTAH